MSRTSSPSPTASSCLALTFRPVNLEAHMDTCVRFRIDTYVCGFGSAERFHEHDGNGAARYAEWLRKRVQTLPGCLVHLWQGNEIIGQIEMARVPSDRSIGYVNLFYLVPKARGQGLGRLLEAYAWAWLSGLGCRSLRLSASPTNAPAWLFYQKQGWQDLGHREDDPAVHLLQKRGSDPRSAFAHSGPIWTQTSETVRRVPFTLSCERLQLVPADIRLAEPVTSALNASYTLHRDFLVWSQPHRTLEETKQNLEVAARDFFLPAGEKRYFVLPRSGAPEIIGCIGLLPREDKGAAFEIGYWASQSHSGKGLMKEALNALVSALESESLYLTAASTNTASQRLAESVGFEHVDVIVGARESERFGVHDTWVYRRSGVEPRGLQ